MSEAFTGGCACGAIHYEIAAEPVFMNDCQCRDCQRKSGTGHGSYLTFPDRRSVKLTGDAKHWELTGDTGNVKTRAFCPACGSPVYMTSRQCRTCSPCTRRVSTIPPDTSRRR